MAVIANIVLSSGSISVTIYTEEVENNYTKQLRLIKAPTTTQNYSAGPKETLILDLLQVEDRFTVRGHIDESDFANLRSLLTKGGVFNLTYGDIGTFTVNSDKFSIRRTSRREDDHMDVVVSLVKGKD